jgi:small subunit ribosomal protein S1
MAQANQIAAPSKEEFEALLNESFETRSPLEGIVVRGIVLRIEREHVVVDVGLKTEGRIDLKEFASSGRETGLKVGDPVDVYVERIENARGEAVLSRDKARREESWIVLEQAHARGEKVEGLIFSRVKGGFTVDLNGAIAFLPGSQVDVRPLRDPSVIMNSPQQFAILKMDHRRGNIVVSRRAVMEEARAEQRAEMVESLKEGMIIEGVVKNITDYGAFIDLGGVDGLLHVTDISWKRISHPSEALTIGQPAKVQIIRISAENQRISLGMKQLEQDPWTGMEGRLVSGTRHKGRITNVADYGAFVEIVEGVEGLIHVSEMSWVKKNLHPSKLVSVGQEVEVVVLEVDMVKRRISLGLKQCTQNPWQDFANSNPVDSTIEGEIRNITEFGLFVALGNDIDGMVHLNDLDWNRSGDEAIKEYTKGQVIKARVLEVDIEKERVALGIKQLAGDPYSDLADSVKKGDVVTCTVRAVNDNGIEVHVADGISAFIRKADLSRDRAEQRPARFSVGDKVDAKVTGFDKSTRSVSLSIKALEIAEEKEAVAQYGSSDSGASLGDILGAALRKKQEQDSAE